LEITLLM